MVKSGGLDRNFKVHFIGIGGVNTSALAAFLIKKGFIVSGSDRSFNVYCDNLETCGAQIFIGHNKENVKGADVVVYTSAVDENNEELKFALQNKIPVYSRAELLDMISSEFKVKIGIAGAHGKTTVTALLTHVLFEAGLFYTSFIGGEDKTFENFSSCGNDYFLTEVCEYKKNIDKFTADIAVALNVDNDHLDCYKDLGELKDTFLHYLSRSKLAVINADDESLKSFSGDKITFGLNDSADYYPENIRTSSRTAFNVYERGKKLFRLNSKLTGVYNVYNILAAVALARNIGIEAQTIKNAVEKFEGVKRRNEYLGKINGLKCYSDYAHHPKELLSLINNITADKKSDIRLVFQPHTYSRTKLLFNDFVEVLSKVEHLYLYKTYAARERFDKKFEANALLPYLKNAQYFDDFDELYNELILSASKYDRVYFVGAGDIDELIRNKLK